MQKRLFYLTLLIIGMIIALGIKANLAKADGGIFYPVDYYSAETVQKAFIYFADQTENLVILASFKGNAKDFAWVIPTPNEPEINKGSVSLFNDLAEITKTTRSGPDTVYNTSGMLGLSGSTKPTVEVISEKTIDVYNTAVLKANDENALAKWLSDNGYSFPADQSQNLKSYVDNGWYFAVAKIKPDLIGGGGIVAQLESGTLTPLRLTFQSDKIIYPMKLTGIALTQTVSPTILTDNPEITRPVNSGIPITLYVLSDHKTEQSQLSMYWANWIGGADIKKLDNDLGANIISGQKLFLTKMSETIKVKDINGDFVITAASDNNGYPVSVYRTVGFWLENLLFIALIALVIIFFPVPIGLIFIVFILLQTFVRKKWLYVIGSAYEISACLTLLGVGLLIIMENSSDLLGLFQENGFIGGLISFLALEILGIYLTVKMIKRYRRTFETKELGS